MANYDDNTEELGKLVEKESMMTKFVKAGIVALAVSTVGKKSAGSAVGKLLSNDTAKYSAIAIGTMALSNDDNKGGDLAVASSLIAGMAGVKTARSMLNTADGMAKVQKSLAKADDLVNSTSLKIFNINEKIKEVAGASFGKNMLKNVSGKENYFDISLGIAKTIGQVGYDLVSAPVKNFSEFGLVNGFKKNMEALDDVSIMKKYNSMTDIERSQMKVASNMAMGSNSTKVFEDGDSIGSKVGEFVASKFGIKGLFTNVNAAAESELEMAKKINKIHSIKTSSTFSDMGGMYTKYNVDTGKVDLNIARLGSDESSNVDMLDKIYKNYVKDAKSELGNRQVFDPNGKAVLDKDKKNVYEDIFNTMSSEDKEKGFVNYLNENGFEDFVKNNYKVDNAVTYADVDKMFRGKTLAKDATIDAVTAKTNAAFKAGKLDEDSYNNRMGMIQNLRDKNNMIASDIADHIHNNLDNRNLQKFVEVDNENLYSTGVKNADVLKNFTFTNVVSKSAEFGYSDKTALDGTIIGLKMLGMVEKSFVGNFKMPLARSFNTWNPLKLLETENRIKEKVANDFSKYGTTSNGFISNGRLTQHQSYVEEVAGGLKNKTKKEYKSEYYSDGKDSYKRVFKKQSLDIIDDNYEVLKSNEKTNKSYKDILTTYKTKGIKAAAEEASNSQMNPYSFRYKKGEGMRMANPEESYFNETPIWQGLFNNNLGNSSVINKMEAKGKNTGLLRRTANMILGEHGDINGRELNIQNNFILGRKEVAEKILVRQILNVNQLDPVNDINNPATKAIIDGQFGGDAGRYLQSKSPMNTLTNRILEMASKSIKTTDPDYEKNVKALNALDASRSKGFKFDSKEDEEIVIDAMRSFFEKTKKENGSDFLTSFTERAVKTIRNSPDGPGKFDEALADTTALQGDSAQAMEGLLKFVKGVDGAVDNAIGSSVKQVSKNSLVNNTDALNHVKKSITTDPNIIGNELKDMYDLNLGYELNHLIKNDEHVKNTMGYLDNLSEAFSSTGDLDGSLGSLKQAFSGSDKSFAKNAFGQLMEGFSDQRNQKEINQDFKTYDFFDNLNNEIGVPKGEKQNSFIEAVEVMREAKYVQRKEALGASLIVEDSLKEALNVRSIMDATRKFIQSFMDGNKRSFSGYKAVADSTKGSSLKILSSSKNFGNVDSTFGLFMKTAINKVQGPLEFIGIERMTNKQLGSNWTSQYKNFFKYRYVPLAASVLAYNAVDSGTDALVPDEAGILGNGITGVATRTYATARVGVQYAAKYTGLLSVVKAIDKVVPVDNGLTWMLDLTMDPEEMKDVYFNGKAVRVNKNRNWYTAGRQTGEGEEFGEYRPHLLYTMGNKTAGVYSNKVEKFFRQDFALTKYPWYALDPYKEERDAFEKFGAAYPKTEQMFKDVPIFGHLLGATIGEIIKPTRYIAEEAWRVGDNMMKNPGYNPNDPNSPEFIEFKEPNKLLAGVFDAVEDYKTFAGMHGYLFGKATEMFFGKTNPYKDKVVLSSIDEDTSMSAQYENLQLGGMFGTTEGVRRLLDGESLGTISVNPLEQNLPEWMPDFYKKGQNPYMKKGFGQYIMPGADFDKTYNATGNEEVDRLKTLSMLAPYSKDFDSLKQSIQGNISNLSKDEQKSFYESLGYAEDYNKREYDDTKASAKNVSKTSVKIDKKVSYNEFISGGKRYKIDDVESNFNKVAEKVGNTKAINMFREFEDRFEEGGTYQFDLSKDAQYSVGKDRDGDYIKVGAGDVSSSMKGESVYNTGFSKALGNVKNAILSKAMTADLEKVFGKKTAYNEWSQESVQSPYFRDWDSVGSSFIEPYYNFSANSMMSAFLFGNQANKAFMNSNATMNLASALVTAGTAKNVINTITGGVTRSSQYEDDAEVNRELQKVKDTIGEKSYFNMTGNENLAELKSMVNESDAQFLEGLINTTSTKERAKILKFADTTTSGVLQRVWNKQQELIGNGNSDKMYEIEQETYDTVTDIGQYGGDSDQARIALKLALGVGRTKLDAKKIGLINSYRGSQALGESEYIKEKIYKGYNSKTVTTSTIYPKGTININRRD